MKTLRESLFDQDTDIDQTELERAVIAKWLEDNYNMPAIYNINMDKHMIEFRRSNITIKVKNKKINRILPEGWRFGNIEIFICDDCESLESLEGVPFDCTTFNCSGCTSLKSLKGAPEGCVSFHSEYCESLESLEGAPTHVDFFNCSGCTSLKSLKGAPKQCVTFYCAGCKSLKSLEGSPRTIEWHFSCSGCTSLKSLKGAPKKVGGSFGCKDCPIEDYSILDKIEIGGEITK